MDKANDKLISFKKSILQIGYVYYVLNKQQY